MTDIPFGTTDRRTIESTEDRGERGAARRRTMQFGEIRVRQVDYPAGYVADHGCVKGHILYCLEGELRMEREDGATVHASTGHERPVADHAEAHRSSTATGARLFIVD